MQTTPADSRVAFAIAFMRVGFGLVFLTHGIAKLTGWDGIHPFPGFLINAEGARGILSHDVQTHPIGLYKDLIDNVVLANYDTLFGPLLTLSELFVGLALVTGAFASAGALMGAGFALHLNFAVWDRNVWAWEYAVEWIPLISLSLLASGRYWGLDGWVSRRLPRALNRWPLTG
jgi:uncharacterized membrane protein YphA (DoxX/SURF4 family)